MHSSDDPAAVHQSAETFENWFAAESAKRGDIWGWFERRVMQLAWEAASRQVAAPLVGPVLEEDAVHGRCAGYLRLFNFKHGRDPYPQEIWDAALVLGAASPPAPTEES